MFRLWRRDVIHTLHGPVRVHRGASILYAAPDGSLQYRSTSGQVTTIGPADPDCKPTAA